jgi:hypothetical protein
MEFNVRTWSKAFAPSPDTDPFSLQVDSRIWEESIRDASAQRTFVQIHHPRGGTACIAPLGQPVHVEGEDHAVYMPLWMLDSYQFSEDGEETRITIHTEESFPEATRLVFRVVDSAFYNSDVKEELERALSALGVVQKHTVLQVPIAALGGFAVEVFVSETEPANIVFCQGEEVAVEFEEPIDAIRPPTPIPPTPVAIEEMFGSMLPSEEQASPPVGFRAFQGQGNLLGGSNGQIPEWRRGLPPPHRR